MKALTEIAMYSCDGRKHISEVYSAFDTLFSAGWKKETIFNTFAEDTNLPILSFSTAARGPAIWLIAGIHGEEPAGPIAFAEYINVIKDIGEKMPTVVLPLCNPQGYRKNWRYLNRPDFSEDGLIHSVGDSEYLLPRAKCREPTTSEAGALTKQIIKMSELYPPKATFNFHEDNEIDSAYIYSHGQREEDIISFFLLGKLKNLGIPLQKDGLTRYNEPIKEGIVSGEEDGSIDELLVSESIIFEGKYVQGPGAKICVVTEIPSKAFPLVSRVYAYGGLLSEINRFVENRKSEK